MEANAKKHLKHMCYLGLTLAVFVGGVWIHQQDTISSNNRIVHMTQLKARQYRKSRMNYTVPKLQENYDKNEPNLGSALSTNQRNVKKGLQLAFSSCTTPHALNQSKGKVESLLGSNVADTLMNSLQAQLRDSNTTGSQKRTKGDSIDMLHISYGKYDDSEAVIPVEVLVKYATPPIKQDGGSGSLKPVGQKKVSPIHKGYMEYDATFNPKTKGVSLNHYHNQLQHSN